MCSGFTTFSIQCQDGALCQRQCHCDALKFNLFLLNLESGPRAEIQQRMERVSILNIFLGKECEQDFTPDTLQLVSEGI